MALQKMSHKGNSKSSRLGRKPKKIKSNKPMVAYFTETEKKIIENYCNSLSFSFIVKQFFLEKGSPAGSPSAVSIILIYFSDYLKFLNFGLLLLWSRFLSLSL